MPDRGPAPGDMTPPDGQGGATDRGRGRIGAGGRDGSAVAAVRTGAGRPRAALTDSDILCPPIWEMIALAGLLGYFIIAFTFADQDDYEALNNVGCLALAAILLAGAWRLAMTTSISLWLGLLWFRISTAIYFGIGSVVHVFFNAETERLTRTSMASEPVDYLKFSMVIVFGSFIVLATCRLITILRPAKPVVVKPDSSDDILFVCAVAFSVIGFSVKYLVTIPAGFGAFGRWVAPGMLNQISLLATVGLFLLTLWSVKHAPRLVVLCFALLAAEMTVGCLLFNKSEVLKPLIVVILALLQHRSTGLRLLIAAAAVIVTFSTIVPLVDFGRIVIITQHNPNAGLGERLDIVSTYIEGEKLRGVGDDYQGDLARIAYASSCVPAITFYDGGQPGDTLSIIYTIFIPRMFWKDKPIYNIGSKYNELIFGSDTSASWMGLFAEGYWNMGWWGTCLVASCYAFIMYFIGVMSIQISANRRWLHFPIAFFGLYTGIRTDGSFVLESVTAFVVCILLHVVATVAENWIRPLITDAPTSGAAAPLGARSATRPLASSAREPASRS